MEYKGQALSRGQGAIEYLLLLAAAVVVVAVVVSFMISTIGPVQDSGSKQTYEYICGTLDTNSLVCGCFEKTATKGDFVNGTYTQASTAICNEQLSDPYKTDPLLQWN
ncbi:MAG: class III signal peptide-containing protein [archaeon]|jgi:hypothetical protein